MANTEIKPANPVTPTVKSLPPLMTIMGIPAVAFNVPCKMAAAMTDFALMVMYKNYLIGEIKN